MAPTAIFAVLIQKKLLITVTFLISENLIVQLFTNKTELSPKIVLKLSIKLSLKLPTNYLRNLLGVIFPSGCNSIGLIDLPKSRFILN